MKIPKRFQLGPHTYQVRILSVKEMKVVHEASGGEAKEEAPWGLFVRGENVIYVQKVRIGFCVQQQLHTFWHEYFHALLASLNKTELWLDEELVDQCGLLHLQMVQSAKY